MIERKDLVSSAPYKGTDFTHDLRNLTTWSLSNIVTLEIQFDVWIWGRARPK